MENLNEEYLDVFGNFDLSQDEKVQRYLEPFVQNPVILTT